MFLTSGIIHLVLDLFCWEPPSKLPTLAFFGFFAVAIMGEDAIQELCRRITGIVTTDGKHEVPLWHKLVGYTWVSLWLILTSPWYLYHSTRLPPETKWLVPVSLVDVIGFSATSVLLVGGGLALKFAIGGEI